MFMNCRSFSLSASNDADADDAFGERAVVDARRHAGCRDMIDDACPTALITIFCFFASGVCLFFCFHFTQKKNDVGFRVLDDSKDF